MILSTFEKPSNNAAPDRQLQNKKHKAEYKSIYPFSV